MRKGIPESDLGYAEEAVKKKGLNQSMGEDKDGEKIKINYIS